MQYTNRKDFVDVVCFFITDAINPKAGSSVDSLKSVKFVIPSFTKDTDTYSIVFEDKSITRIVINDDTHITYDYNADFDCICVELTDGLRETMLYIA